MPSDLRRYLWEKSLARAALYISQYHLSLRAGTTVVRPPQRAVQS